MPLLYVSRSIRHSRLGLFVYPYRVLVQALKPLYGTTDLETLNQ